ncbi:MAG: glutathione S-transferase family protein [Gammaproteobacteria bacterium]|nr:glutathione S-transferase family protein [Gammaproteobacteria bacterium]
MAYTLHGAPLSPFVRKVMYLLASTNTDYKLKVVAPGSMPDEFVNISPLKRIPVLQENDWYQPDSSIVCNYLIETLDHPALGQLIPSNAKARAQVRWLEKFADYELAPWLTFVVFRERILRPIYNKTTDETSVQKALHKNIPPLFDYLSTQLGNQTYFMGDVLTLGDIAITSQMVSFMHGGEVIDDQRWPKLSSYFKHMMQQPIWQALVTREQVTLNKILAAKNS